MGGIGDAAIGAEALAALADGFESYDGNAILTIGHGVDVDKVLTDESLDHVDTPATRKKLHKVFLSVFSELCRYIDEVFDHFQKFMDTRLNDKLWQYLLSPDAEKLYPALEGLKHFCRIKNPDDPPEFEILNLVAGMVFCSLPGALKECCSSDSDIGEKNLRFEISSIHRVTKRIGITNSRKGRIPACGLIFWCSIRPEINSIWHNFQVHPFVIHRGFDPGNS